MASFFGEHFIEGKVIILCNLLPLKFLWSPGCVSHRPFAWTEDDVPAKIQFPIMDSGHQISCSVAPLPLFLRALSTAWAAANPTIWGGGMGHSRPLCTNRDVDQVGAITAMQRVPLVTAMNEASHSIHFVAPMVYLGSEPYLCWRGESALIFLSISN